MKNGEYRNWAELPAELTSSILHRLGVKDILDSAQKVCRSWRRVCKDSSMWRKIDMRNLGNFKTMGYNLEVMCRHLVDRSEGCLLEIYIEDFGSNSLLAYIADRSKNLRRFAISICYPVTRNGLVNAIRKLPSLEDLEISYCSVSELDEEAIYQSCPWLKTLKLNQTVRFKCGGEAREIPLLARLLWGTE